MITHTDLKYQSFVVTLNKFTQPMVQLSAKTKKSTSICIQVFRVYHTSSIENCTNLNTDKKQTISSGYFRDNSTGLKLNISTEDKLCSDMFRTLQLNYTLV